MEQLYNSYCILFHIKDFKLAVLSSTESTLLDHVEERKRQRKKEKIAKEAFMKFALHILFALILFSISYTNRDQRSFYIKTHIENHLYTSSKYNLGFSKVSFDKAANKCLNIPKAAIRGGKSKKDRQYNDQAKKGQREKRSLRRIPKW